MQGDEPNDDAEAGPADPARAPTRRRALLTFGALGASAVVTIRPALAATAGSVLHCTIPVPDPSRAGQYIAADGSTVPPGTQGAYPPSPRRLTGEEVRTMMRGGQTPAGLDPEQARAYMQYIRRLQHGQSGFTCFASLQMPRG